MGMRSRHPTSLLYFHRACTRARPHWSPTRQAFKLLQELARGYDYSGAIMNLDESGAKSEPQPNTNGESPSSDRTESKAPATKGNQFDVWLQRLSHLSQFGIFLFTVWAIFFTVVPLYQKELLEEAIAKREVELKEANTALERAYGRIKFTVVKDFVFMAGARCSGLLYRPGEYIPEKPPVADLFEMDVPACLTRAAEKYIPLKELRAEDRRLFDQSLLALNKQLGDIRQRARQNMTRSLNVLPPTLPHSHRQVKIVR